MSNRVAAIEPSALEVLHAGSHAVVYRARLPDQGASVVLKVLRKGFDGPADVARLEREFAIASRIDSPAVVRVLALTQYQGRPALVAEDFGAHSLDRELGAPLPVERFLALAIGIAHALGEVHRHGVVHKDIKPHNVLLAAATGELRITDFGLATARGVERAAIDGFEGTPAYMAPEQTGRTNRAVDPRADLYALGVTLYQMLTGALPFEGHDALEWVHCHLARSPRPPAQLVPDVPAVLSALVLKLLAKAPEDRYQSARGLESDLRRCARAWQATREIPAFRLAEDDVSEVFQIPQKLYGRERELRALRDAFDRVLASGASQTVLVAGYAGIGKSSLVRELHAPVVGARGLFAAGKFDQQRRHVPYSAWSEAIRALVHQVLGSSPAQLAAWRRATQAAVGANGRVLTDVFPDVARLIEPPPPVAALGPTETQNRFQLVFRSLLGVFATREHPVVLFLDDLQWADPASLALLETVAADASALPVLLVLAFRDHEVEATHPFALTVARARAAGARIDQVTVPALDAASVGELVGDTLRATPAQCASLVALVVDKTAGNPFFVNEFLRTLYLEALLRFDPTSRAWRWSAADIDAKAITDNVVELMLDRLRGLPAATRRALELAACIGNSFELEPLAIVSECTRAQAAAALEPAIDGGLVLPPRAQDAAGGSYQFRHDRIQQAAYSLIDDAQRAAVHLRIGRLMLAGLGAAALDARLFDVVNQLDAAVALVTAPAERATLAELNARAGRRARAATAYAQARDYLALATALGPDDAWSTRYAETFALFTDLAECDYLCGRLDDARAGFANLLAHAASDLDRGRVFYLQMKLLQVAGDLERATDVALRSFELFGLAPPSDDAAAAACEAEARDAVALLGDRPIADLLDAPRMTDPTVRMLVDLLEASGPPIYMVRPALFAWITLKMVNLSLRHGNAEASCYAYGIYALLRAASMGDVDGGYAFAWLAIRLNDRLGDVRLKGCMLHLLGDHVNFWKNPVATDLPILDRGFQACLEGGDLIYSNYIGFQSPWHLYESGATLDEVWALTAKYAAFALQSRYRPVYQTLRLEQRFILDLKGQPALEDAAFDADAALAEITAARFGCGIVYHYILEMIRLYHRGEYAAALAAGRAAEPHLGAAFSMPMYVSFVLYHGLALAAVYPDAAPDARAAHLAAMQAHHAQLTTWARGCPANFADKAALLGAEIARAQGRSADALGLYEVAIVAARTHGLVQYQALASERAGQLYLALGVASVSALMLGEARALYRRWGALGPVARLEAAHPALEETRWESARPMHGAGTSSSSSSATALDLLPVVKASQSISGEMILSRLLERLMQIVIEYAGAERGFLVLADGDRLTVAAEADANHTVSRVDEPAAITASTLPLTVLNYVRRTGDRVLLDDASLPSTFASDAYVAARRPRSVLCLPIARQGRLTGMFYLENNLLAAAFGAERLTVLELLAGQTAISIDNSRLYNASQQAVEARDAFLSIASHELRTPLTPLKLRLQSLVRHARDGTLTTMPPERLTRLVDVVDSQMTRMARLIDGLLDVSRLQTGTLRLQRERVDLAALAADVIARRARDSEAARSEVALDAPAPVVGDWDAVRVEQLLDSLLANALKYAAGTAVTVTVAPAGEHARLVVRDRGAGIASDDALRIFERFARVPSRDHVPGLGLGLFLSRQIAEAHGGSIRVESRVGEGSTFIVELPFAAPTPLGEDA